MSSQRKHTCRFRWENSLSSFTSFQALKGLRNKYNLLVFELKNSEIPDYSATVMGFINTILVSTETLEERNRIRNTLSCKLSVL